jgi:hypothetical protein
VHEKNFLDNHSGRSILLLLFRNGNGKKIFSEYLWMIVGFIIVIGLGIVFIILGSSNPTLGGLLVSDQVKQIAQAIANAEGFGVAGAIPTHAHNPGDLELGDLGNGTINSKTVFASDQDGWNALYKQVELMISGGSSHYQPTDTWRRIAMTWTGDPQDYVNWLSNVTGSLGVDPDSTLGEYANA